MTRPAGDLHGIAPVRGETPSQLLHDEVVVSHAADRSSGSAGRVFSLLPCLEFPFALADRHHTQQVVDLFPQIIEVAQVSLLVGHLLTSSYISLNQLNIIGKKNTVHSRI